MASIEDDLGNDYADYAAAASEFMEKWDEDGEPVAWKPPDQDDLAAVNSMLRRVQRLAAERDRYLEKRNREVELLDAWVEDRTAGINAQIGRYEDALERWMRARGEEGVSTEKLPSGELWLREGRSSVVVPDTTPALIGWAVEHHAVRIRTEIDKTTAAKLVHPGKFARADERTGYELWHAVDEDGVVVDGLLLRVPSEKLFSIHAREEPER